MHLFDIDVPGGIRFQESEVLSPGNRFLTFDTGKIIYTSLYAFMLAYHYFAYRVHLGLSDYPEWCKIGVGICYDMRFQELASIYNQRGDSVVLYGMYVCTVEPLLCRHLWDSCAERVLIKGISQFLG